MEEKVTQHCARRLLELCFSCKKDMADALNVSYRALLRLFNGNNFPGDTQRIMNAIAQYCMEKHIPPEELFEGFAPCI